MNFLDIVDSLNIAEGFDDLSVINPLMHVNLDQKRDIFIIESKLLLLIDRSDPEIITLDIIMQRLYARILTDFKIKMDIRRICIGASSYSR